MMYFKYPIVTNFMFFNPLGEKGHVYNYSSDLEKIGMEWDVAIANGTYIDVISEPFEIDRPKYGGLISVIKIKADVATDYHTIIKEFWVPTTCVIDLKNVETSNTQFRN